MKLRHEKVPPRLAQVCDADLSADFPFRCGGKHRLQGLVFASPPQARIEVALVSFLRRPKGLENVIHVRL